MSKAWYIINSYSNYENKAKEQLLERIKLEKMEDLFGRIEIPVHEVVELKGGKEKITEKKFFPGYILVQMEMNDDLWHLVKKTPKIMGFIGGTSDRPAPISENEAMSIMSRIKEGVEKPKHKVLYETGEVIRVIDGPFNDFNGVVEEVNYEKNRMLVAVQIFGRSTPVELEFSQVEKA